VFRDNLVYQKIREAFDLDRYIKEKNWYERRGLALFTRGLRGHFAKTSKKRRKKTPRQQSNATKTFFNTRFEREIAKFLGRDPINDVITLGGSKRPYKFNIKIFFL
jgi:hypothetical protein